MTDRELLELAAKAAGYEYTPDSFNYQHPAYWNPLAEDGDALRLAVKLHMALTFCTDGNMHAEGLRGEYACDCMSDPYAATRRAIVRAAAEIGQGMK